MTNTNIDQFLTGCSSIVYNFANSPFNNSDHGHFVAGDLRTIKDNKLGKLSSKVSKYSEPRKIDFDEVRESNINVLKVVFQHGFKIMEY